MAGYSQQQKTSSQKWIRFWEGGDNEENSRPNNGKFELLQ